MNILKRSFFFILLAAVCLTPSQAQDAWSTDYAYYGKGGKLSYTPDEEGNVIPDFSHVGYRYGDESIPDISTVVEVSPVDGDDGAVIQAAIESLYSVTPDENGFRGAVLLKAGTYQVNDQIEVNKSGIVLRGEGQDENGTIIIATGTSTRVLLEFGTSGSLSVDNGSKVQIKEDFVPVGRNFVVVESASGYSVGDQIALYRPGTSQWISDIKMDQISADSDGTPSTQWTPSSYSFYFEREITKVSGDSIFFRNPVVMALDKTYGGGFVYKSSMSRIENVGVENICFKSEYASATDENHSWTAVQFNNVKHAWAKNVTSWYFAFSCVAVEIDAKLVSVIDCSCFEPKSLIDGSRRYSFYCVGQLNLFKGCVTTEGRHDFVTSSRVCGPNVFTQCSATNAYADIGPHHRWAMGTLYDLIETDGQINVQDRDNMGSGHGWSGANQVFWNCVADASICQSPWVSAKNYNFGFQGDKLPGYKNDRPDGVWVGQNQTGLFPASLYEAQLTDRTGNNLVFSSYTLLNAVNDSLFRMTFNLPLKQSTVLKENFVIGGTAGVESKSYTVTLNDEYSVDILFSEIGILPAYSTILIEAQNVLSETDLSLTGLNTSYYTEPDKRPVVSGPTLQVTNENGSFAVAQSTKKGYVYLIKMGEANSTLQDFELALDNHYAAKAEIVTPNVSVPIYTKGIYGGVYLMYAIDEDGRISVSGDDIVIVEEVISVSVETELVPVSFNLNIDRNVLYITPSVYSESYQVSVFDINGRILNKTSVVKGTQIISVPQNQLVIVRITGNSVTETHKLVVTDN